MLVFLFGSGTFAIYQVLNIEDQLDEVTRAVDHMDEKVKHAQYEKAKFFSMARDVLRLASKDPKAQEIAVEFKLRQLQAAQPVLMDLSEPPPPVPTDAASAQRAAAMTNSAPIRAFEPPSAAPMFPAAPPIPVTK